MPYICDYCELIYPEGVTTCPSCRRKIIHSNKTVESLRKEGYVEVNEAGGMSSQSHQQAQRDLQSLFMAQQSEEQPTYTQETKTPTTAQAANTGEMNLEKEDFFAQFETNDPPVQIPEITFEPIESQRVGDVPYPESQSQQNTEPRNTGSSYRPVTGSRPRRPFQLPLINWRVVGRVIVIVAIIIALLTIWSQRAAIFGWFLNLLTALIPFAVVIAIIVWIFRAIFR